MVAASNDASFKWQVQRVAFSELDVRMMQAGDGEHLRAEVEPDHPPGRTHDAGQLRGQLARPARDVQGRATRFQTRLARGATAPPSVCAQGKHRVDQVVSVRDAVEHRPHRGGVAFAHQNSVNVVELTTSVLNRYLRYRYRPTQTARQNEPTLSSGTQNRSGGSG